MSTILRVGADPFPPYQYYDESGVVRGIDSDTVTAAFEEAGYKIEIELMDWSDVQKKFDNGELHAIFQVQPDPERLAKYCTGTPARLQISAKIALLMPSVVYFWLALNFTTIPSFMKGRLVASAFSR